MLLVSHASVVPTDNEGDNMIQRDHDLMVRVTKSNRHLGEAMLEAMNARNNETQAVGLREIGRHLGELSADLLARAAELDGRTLEYPERVIIDARP